MIWDHMGDRDARRPGFCAEFDRGRDGRGPGPPNPLKKLKIYVFRGFRGLGPILPIGPVWAGPIGPVLAFNPRPCLGHWCVLGGTELMDRPTLWSWSSGPYGPGPKGTFPTPVGANREL